MDSGTDEIPRELSQLRLCSALRNCGGGVERNFSQSDASDISVFDDNEGGCSVWELGDTGRSDVLLVRNPNRRNVFLLPLDNRILSGKNVSEGGVADCALLTMSSLALVEFKTNVHSNSSGNLSSKTEEAIRQLWHTYDGVIAPKCKEKGVEIAKVVNVDFNIVFDGQLDVTQAQAERMDRQLSFFQEKGFPLFFDNEKGIV